MADELEPPLAPDPIIDNTLPGDLVDPVPPEPVLPPAAEEYPKTLYKAEPEPSARSVANADEEAAAVAEGYGPHPPPDPPPPVVAPPPVVEPPPPVEYPKTLYRAEPEPSTIGVATEEEEAAARGEGYVGLDEVKPPDPPARRRR